MYLIKKNEKIIAALNDDIIFYNIENQTDYHIKVPDPVLPEDVKKKKLQTVEEKNITAIEFSKLGDYIAVATESKQVIVYDKNFYVKKHFITNRAPSKMCFTPLNNILVADKTGDVYMYKLNTEEHHLLLGHLSVILDMVISECGKYIITCDRDEKIRVSCFPNCYNIVSFCLGHKEFVTKINLVGNVLISASGDGTLRFWNYIKGEEVGLINTNNYIDENNLLANFVAEMDKEKVDVTALPITDMQICRENKLYIAVSIHSYNGIQLYTADLLPFKFNFIGKITLNNPFTFLLQNNLYILSNNFLVFKIVDDTFIQTDSSYGEKFYDKYRNILKFDKHLDICVFYKRKFNNVKEYLERKKKRLEAK